MAQHIKLHGGPMHGKEVALQDGVNFFHIAKPLDPIGIYAEADAPIESNIKQGTYSRVRDSTDFEWDGWR